MSIHEFTADEIALMPAADAGQLHDLYEAANGDETSEFTVLAEHCSHCGRPLPAVVE